MVDSNEERENDYVKVISVIANENNKSIHLSPILKLINFYCRKWNLEFGEFETISNLAIKTFAERGMELKIIK